MAHTQQEVLEGLTQIVVDEAGIPAESISLEKSFADDLGVDSLTMMAVVTVAEEQFSVRIPDDDVAGLVTVGDAVTYIVSADEA